MLLVLRIILHVFVLVECVVCMHLYVCVCAMSVVLYRAMGEASSVLEFVCVLKFDSIPVIVCNCN